MILQGFAPSGLVGGGVGLGVEAWGGRKLDGVGEQGLVSEGVWTDSVERFWVLKLSKREEVNFGKLQLQQCQEVSGFERVLKFWGEILAHF